MDYRKLLETVYEAALHCNKRGAGYSQQRVVLDEVAARISNVDRFIRPHIDDKLQQDILTCWHDLFREGRLSWGYDLDNPDAPFFHIPTRDSLAKQAS